MNIWLTSDLHLSHKLVSGLRGFWMNDQDGVRVPDTFAHDVTLAENWDAVVQPDDLVYVLGDLSINSGLQVDEWFKDRPGRKRLISGNHDKSHTAIFKPAKSGPVIERWSSIFESILDEDVIEIAGRKVTLSHFPSWEWGDGERARQDGYVSRYEKIRPWMKDDTILLHGHTHDVERDHGREYHVGLDGHGLQLVPLQTIEDWVKTLD
jgi:calcineurin-like phosphoesterase family protein